MAIFGNRDAVCKWFIRISPARKKTVAAVSVLILFFFMVFDASTFVQVILMQRLLDYIPVQAGLALLPGFPTLSLSCPLAGRVAAGPHQLGSGHWPPVPSNVMCMRGASAKGIGLVDSVHQNHQNGVIRCGKSALPSRAANACWHRRKLMGTFTIQPHGRLQEWIADEKGYFRDEGLAYALNMRDRTLGGVLPAPVVQDQPGKIVEVLAGAFESYEAGQGRKGVEAGDISCACHWTVNQAAKVKHGLIWGKAYAIADGAILVPPDTDLQTPEDLAGRDVAVGYHSGSHYSAQQALEVFLMPEDMQLKFVGPPWSRVDLALARQVSAVNVWGPQRYLLEQQGFRPMVDTTFMITFMYPAGTDEDHIERYIRALQRAQMDLDLAPERYKHHFLKEIPERYHGIIDVRRFGTGERIVFLPYSREMFDTTQTWMHDRKLFDVGPEVGVGYDVAVRG